MQNARRACLLAALLLTAACGPADDVRVQPLPPLAMLSAEARAGVPTVSGVWRFAGWEVAEGDSASLQAPLPGFGAISLDSQKRDSLGGSYMLEGGRAPLAGEIRRDSVISLVTFLAPGDGRFLAGTLARDTFWMETTSLTEPGRWPDGARVAFVRTPVAGAPFLRMRGALPPPPPVDSLALDSINAAAAPVTTAPPATASPLPRPGEAAPRPAAPAARPPAATPRPIPDSSGAPTPATPRPITPRPPPVTPPAEEPEPEETQPRAPRLLGVPVQRDTAGGDGAGVP